MSAPSRTARTRERAAKRVLAASSIAPVACGYERGRVGFSSAHELPKAIRASEHGYSRLASTIGTRGDTK